MSKNNMIIINGLKKSFGDVKAVNGISFDVKKGEIFGLLGPNGAGKTTILKLLLALLEPDDGEISIFGMDPERDEVRIKQKIGYVSEEPLIYKSLTPRDLFNFIGSIRKIDKASISKHAQKYLESLGAFQYVDNLIANLSRGNKQKIQIVASLLHKPDLIILDEPFSGLDAKSVKVVKEILEMHIQKGGSVLFSTHIMEVAEDLCDRICIINKGKMIGIGTIDELRNQANKVGGRLEDVFLRLTEQDTSIDEIVKKIRTSFKGEVMGA